MANPDESGLPNPDPEFASSERLFRRVPLVCLVDGFVTDAALPSPSFSVNREKYSAPGDVIEGYPGCRVAAFQVADIPDNVTSDTSADYQFGVEHEPELTNYSHSGVHTYHEGLKMDDKPPKSVRKKFRELLRRKIEILELESRG